MEAVIQSVQYGRVHPVFSQTRTDHCRLSSVKPRLLDPDNGPYLGPCLPDGLRQFCPDAGGALGILADAAADNVLQSDVLATKGSCCFQNFPRSTTEIIFSFCFQLSPPSRTTSCAGSFSWTAVPLRRFVMILRFGIHRPSYGSSNSATRLRRMGLLRLLDIEDISRGSEVRIWRKETKQ